MGVYFFLEREADGRKHFFALRRTMEHIIRSARHALFVPSRTLVWSGPHIKSLGGKVIRGPVQGVQFPSESEIRFVNPYSIEIEGHMAVRENNHELKVPSYIVGSTDSNETFGDIHLDSYTFHGRTFKDYFLGDGDDKTANRVRLLEFLEMTRRLTNPLIRMVAGDNVECVQNIILALYNYQRDVEEFVRKLIRLPARLAEEPIHGMLFSKERAEALNEYITPYRLGELGKWINSSKTFKENLDKFVKSKAPSQAGSILIYDQEFKREPILEIYDTILVNLEDLKNSLQSRETLKTRCVEQAERIDFSKKPSRISDYLPGKPDG